MPIRVPLALSSPRSVTADAIEQERQTQQVNDQYAEDQDFIAQQQKEQARIQQAQESAAADAARAQKAVIANAKRAGAVVAPDATGTEQIQRHEDGQPVYQAGFIGTPQVSDKGGAAKYRDARGSSYEVPFDAIRTEQDPAGETFYSFDVTGPDGSKQTMRQPAGTKPLFRVDPTTGNRLADMTDPATGSVRTQVVGIDRPTASKAAIAKRRDALQLRQNEISGQAEELRLQRELKDTLFTPVKERFNLAQDAHEKINKAKIRYEQRPDTDGKLALHQVHFKADGEEEYAMPVSNDPQAIASAQAWIDQKKRADADFAAAKAEHDPAKTELQTMDEQRARLAINILDEKRRAEKEIRVMDEAAKAGQPVYEPEWQKRFQSILADPRVQDNATIADLEDAGDPLAEDVKRVSRPASATALNAALEAGIVSPDSPLVMYRTTDTQGMMEDAPRAKLVDTLTAGLTTGKPATVADSKAAKELAAKSLGMQPDGVEVSGQKPEGHYELTRNGEMFATLDPRNNRLTLLDTPASLQDKGAEIIANASPDGVPVYMVSSQQPFRPAEVRDLIQTGINAVSATKSDAEAKSALAAVGLDSAGIRQKVMDGKLSVQDGKLLNDKFNDVKQADLSAEGMKAGFGKWMAVNPVLAAKFQKGGAKEKAEVANFYADTVAAQAKSGIVRSNATMAASRQALVKQVGGGEEGSLWKNVTSGLKQLPGFAWNAAMLIPRLADRYVVNPNNNDADTELFVEQTENFVNRLMVEKAPWKKDASPMGQVLGEVEMWADRADSVDDMPDELADRLATAAFESYHGFKDGDSVNVNTTYDTYNIKRDPVLRKMMQQYLDTGDASAFNSLGQMLKSNQDERNTDIKVNQYIERPRVATPLEIAARASLLNIQLDPAKAAAILALSKEGETVKDRAGVDDILKRAGQIMGLDPEQAEIAMSEITRAEVTDPDSWTGNFRASSIAPASELAAEVFIDSAIGMMTATVVGAPEALALKAAQVGAKGMRASMGRFVAHNLDNLGARVPTFAKLRTAIGRGRAKMRADVDELAADYAGLGIQKPVFGSVLTTGQKISNAAVATGKAIVAGAPMEGLEEAVVAMLSNDPSLENVTDSALMGALGVVGMVPAFAGVQGIRNAFAAKGQVKQWEKYKQGAINEINTFMGKSAPDFKPLTTADFDAMQAFAGRSVHQAAAQEYAKAQLVHKAEQAAFAEASQSGPAVPPASLLAAQVRLKRAENSLGAFFTDAFMAADALRALPEAERPLYTAAAKAAAGVTDYTEAEAKALMQQSGANAVIFQQAQTLPANVQGPAQLKNLADIPNVTTAAPGVYRLPDGVRLNLPQPLVDMLAQKSPSMVNLMGRGTAPATAQGATSEAATKSTKTTKTPTADATTPAVTPSPTIPPELQAKLKAFDTSTFTMAEIDLVDEVMGDESPFAETFATQEEEAPYVGLAEELADRLKNWPNFRFTKGKEKEEEELINSLWGVSSPFNVPKSFQKAKIKKDSKDVAEFGQPKYAQALPMGERIDDEVEIQEDEVLFVVENVVAREMDRRNRLAQTRMIRLADYQEHDGGMKADPIDEDILINVTRLARSAWNEANLKGGTITRRDIADHVALTIDHEVVHIAQIKAAHNIFDALTAQERQQQAGTETEPTFWEWVKGHYGRVWREEFTAEEQRAVITAYGSILATKDEWIKAFEAFRMLVQTGSKGRLSEAVLRHLQGVLVILKRWYADLKGDLELRPVIKAEIEGIEAVLADAENPARAFSEEWAAQASDQELSDAQAELAANAAEWAKDEGMSQQTKVGIFNAQGILGREAKKRATPTKQKNERPRDSQGTSDLRPKGTNAGAEEKPSGTGGQISENVGKVGGVAGSSSVTPDREVQPYGAAEVAPKTPKSSTQFTLSPADAKPILDFGASIPKDELFTSIDPEWSDGALETEPHVTVLYGLTKHEAAPVAKAIKDHGPVTVTLGKLSIFENGEYDVLKIDVEGPELRSLNAKLSKLPNENSFPDYRPHMTIAYLKKGEGKKYVGDTRFEGQTITFDTMTFSPPSELRGELGKPELPLAKVEAKKETTPTLPTPDKQVPPETAQSTEPSREEWQKTYAKFKRALAKAVKAKDYAEIIRQADAFQAHYEADGNGPFPDTWSDWERHKSEAEMQLARQGSATNPLVVPILKPVTPPRPAASEDADYLKAQEDTRAALGGLFSAPVRRSIPQLEVPEERFDAVRTAAKSIIAAKIRTPEAFAKFLDDTFPGGKARPYSEAIWDVMGVWDKSLRGTHDWSRIYGDIDQPLPEVQEPVSPEATISPETKSEQGAAPASNSVPVSEQYMNEINRLLRKKKAAMIAGNGDLVDSLEDQIEQLRATVPMPTQAPASANEQDEAISLEELGDELHALGAGENTWMKARSPRGPKGTSTDDMPSRQDIEDLAKKRLTDDEWQKLSQDYEDGREVRGSIIATEAAPASAKEQDEQDESPFMRERNATIKASKEAGNVHLDAEKRYVENSRGREIYNVHDPKERGIIRTVSNQGEVVVHWSDKYSGEKNLATAKTEQRGRKKVDVLESWLMPTDLVDYVFADSSKPAPQAKADTPASGLITDEESARLDALSEENMQRFVKLSANQLSQLAIELGVRPMVFQRKGVDQAETLDRTHPDDLKAALDVVTKSKIKADTPATAEAKVEEQVQTIAATEGQRDAKEIKKEIAEKLDAAIAAALENESPRAKEIRKEIAEQETIKKELASAQAKRNAAKTITRLQKELDRETAVGSKSLTKAEIDGKIITIQIPGDGTFKVFNNVETLRNIRKRVSLIETDITPDAPSSESVNRKQDALNLADGASERFGGPLAAIEWLKEQMADSTDSVKEWYQSAIDLLSKRKGDMEREEAEQSTHDSESTSTAGVDESALNTPMMKQWLAMRKELPEDVVLLVRLGDFYEAFGNDAKVLSKLAKVALTKRNGIPMAGIPHHSATGYIQNLVSAGKRVAIAETVGDIKPGMATERKVTSITPEEPTPAEEAPEMAAEPVFTPGQRVTGKKNGDFNRAGTIDSSGPTTDGERTWFVQTDTVGSVVYKESELTPEAVEEKTADVQQEFKDSIQKDFTEFSATFKTSTGNVHDVRVTKRTTNAQITNRLAGMFSKLGKSDEVVEQARSFVDEWNRWHSITGNVSGREVMVRNAKDLAKSLPSEETAPEVASIKSTRKPRAPKKPTLFERLQAYFVPGAIVDSYFGKDRVIALYPDGGIGQGGWSVEVVSVDKDGKDTPGARVRRHSTLPSEKALQKAWQDRAEAIVRNLTPKEQAGKLNPREREAIDEARMSLASAPAAQNAEPSPGGLSKAEVKTNYGNGFYRAADGDETNNIYITDEKEDAERYLSSERKVRKYKSYWTRKELDLLSMASTFAKIEAASGVPREQYSTFPFEELNRAEVRNGLWGNGYDSVVFWDKHSDNSTDHLSVLIRSSEQFKPQKQNAQSRVENSSDMPGRGPNNFTTSRLGKPVSSGATIEFQAPESGKPPLPALSTPSGRLAVSPHRNDLNLPPAPLRESGGGPQSLDEGDLQLPSRRLALRDNPQSVAAVNPSSSRAAGGPLASSPARQSQMLEQAAATLRGEGPPLAPGLRSMFNPQARRPATGERGLFDRPKDQLADSIQKAYRAVQMGQSTVMVPIRAVFQRLKAANPALTVDEYLAAIQAADQRGDVMLEAANTTAEQQANAPFVVPSQSGPGVRMAWMDNRPPQVLASAPSNSPQTPTQKAIYEIRQQLNAADAGRSEYPIPEERLRAQAKSLLQWAASAKRIIDRAELERATTRHAGLGGGEEHDVWHDAGRDRVVKLTKPGAYGIQQDLTRYLDTIEYSNRVFGDDIVIEGVVFKDGWPHILISQPFYRAAGGTLASAPAPDTEREQQVREVLAAMPPIWRNVLQDQWNNKSIEDIAAARNLSLVAVGNILRRSGGLFDVLMKKAAAATPEVAVEDGIVKAVYGRPDLARSGDALMAALDQNRPMPEVVHRAEMEDLAGAMFSGWPTESLAIVKRWMDSGGMMTVPDNLPHGLKVILDEASARGAAPMLMQVAANHALNQARLNNAPLSEQMRLGLAWRELGTEQARAFGARQDTFHDPMERHALYIQKMLTTPQDGDLKTLLNNPASRSRILAEMERRAEDMKRRLKAAGYDLDAWFAEQKAVATEAASFMPPAAAPQLKRLPRKVQHGINAWVAGAKLQDAAREAGMTAQELHDAYADFYAAVNQEALKAAVTAKDEMLRSAPAPNDFAAQIGLPPPPATADPNARLNDTPKARAYQARRENAALNRPTEVAAAMSEMSAGQSGFIGKMAEYWRMSILSGPQTWVVNTSSGLALGMYRNMVQKLGTAGLASIVRATGMADLPNAPALSDIGPVLQHAWDSFVPSLKNAFRSWKHNRRLYDAYAKGNLTLDPGGKDWDFDKSGIVMDGKEVVFKGEKYGPALSRDKWWKLGAIMDVISFRMLLIADEFVRSWFGRIETAAQLRQMARSEPALKKRTEELRAEIKKMLPTAWELRYTNNNGYYAVKPAVVDFIVEEGQNRRVEKRTIMERVGAEEWSAAVPAAKRDSLATNAADLALHGGFDALLTDKATPEQLKARLDRLGKPGSGAWMKGVEAANTITAQSELGTGVRAVDAIDGLADLIQRGKTSKYALVSVPMQFLFPFVATPVNLFKTGITMSPVGGFLALIDAVRSYRRRKAGDLEGARKIMDAARALEEIVNQTVAWGLVLTLSELMEPDDDEEDPKKRLPRFTGTGEWKALDAGERQLAYKTAPPLSFRIGDRWFSYRRLDPFAIALANIADGIDAFKKEPAEKALFTVGVRAIDAMEEKTFLAGAADAMNLIRDPERYGPRWAANIATGFIPNLIRQPVRSADEQFRDKDIPANAGFLEKLERHIGYSIIPQFGPEKLDLWGRNVEKDTDTFGPLTDTAFRLLSPVGGSVPAPDALDVALYTFNLENAGKGDFGIEAPERRITRTIAGQKIVVDLTDEERANFIRQAGSRAHATVTAQYGGRKLTLEDVDNIREIVRKVYSVHRDAAFVAAVQKRGGVNSLLANTRK